jgi:TPR repeat protein
MYRKGEGDPQDYAEAAKWYRLAAEQGFEFAQKRLGVMYEYGNGVLQDNTMAHMWYNIASANGHDKAGEWRDERADLMTNADISKAQAMARECINSGYVKCGY